MKQKLMQDAKEMFSQYTKLQKEGLIELNNDFYPSVHYPPITMYPEASAESLLNTYSIPETDLLDIYVHIPFCIKHCNFCHYPVKTGPQLKEKETYLKALEAEINIFLKKFNLKVIKPRSILIGGGTPTYLQPKQLEHFLNFFTSKLDMSTCTQFNIDLDPPTLLGKDGQERLRILKKYGINRFTIGVQSLNNNILKLMNRPHTAEEAIEAINLSKENGFIVNIEFIFGYHNQSLENWLKTINTASNLNVDEIQLYRLKIIPYGDFNGKVFHTYSKNKYPSVEKVIIMKQAAIQLLAQKGFHQNLRRVFSKKPEIYSHYADNQCCKLYDQIGFGLTAFSSLRDRFALNTQNFKDYYNHIKNHTLPINRGLIRNIYDQVRWCIILPLKNRDVQNKFFQMQTGISLNSIFKNKISSLKESHLITNDDNTLKLTELGSFFADEVCQQFHHPNYIPFPETAYAKGKLNPYLNNDLSLLNI